jgi:hypothetical protein
MTIPAGREVYNCDQPPVRAKGLKFNNSELDRALKQNVIDILDDRAGHVEIQQLVSSVATTQFDANRISEILNHQPFVEDWRVGEALSEAYLAEHRNCMFPWPMVRDLKNPTASPAGADLVGVVNISGQDRFAFGEVKTSQEEVWPPSVMSGRHGLQKQIEGLRDSEDVKNHLVTYLAHRAVNSQWTDRFQAAFINYAKDSTHVMIFGFMIRDVKPDARDLSNRSATLAKKCPTATAIELFAIYLPAGVISELPDRATKARGKK